jgi:hypothetical protein
LERFYREVPTVLSFVSTQGTYRLRPFRLLGICRARDAWIYVASRWYWYAKLELLLQGALWHAINELYCRRILIGPEGGYFHELRLNDPALWRWK